jgi:hypothetical protein
MAMMARTRRTPRTGDDEPDLAAFSLGAPMGTEQRVEPGGVVEPSPGHVDYVGFRLNRPGFNQHRAGRPDHHLHLWAGDGDGAAVPAGDT